MYFIHMCELYSVQLIVDEHYGFWKGLRVSTLGDGWVSVVHSRSAALTKMPSESILFVGSFAVTLALLIFSSRFIINTLELFPPDPDGSPYSIRNILHTAWGSSSPKYKDSAAQFMASTANQNVLGIDSDMVAPIGFAILLGASALIAFFVFGNKKGLLNRVYRHVLNFFCSYV